VKKRKRVNPQHKVQDIKFKEIKAKHGHGLKDQPARMPFDIDDNEDEDSVTMAQSLCIDQDETATFDIVGESGSTRPLGSTSPSKLNSPQKPASPPAEHHLDAKLDQPQTSDHAKERTLALSAILESKIAIRSQSDGAADGNAQKRRVRGLGRATSTSRTNSMNVDDGANSTRKQEDPEMITLETFASQKLEYDDAEMMEKRAKLMAALTKGTVIPEDANVEPEEGRRRSLRNKP
jgi:hypothetical protein